MQRQCIFASFGGTVDVTGEIIHGKTSPLRHDNKGVYAGLPQDLPVTRYHSLAGTHATLPDSLEISSWVAGGSDGGKGIIMGVRHKELLVEGVQFHPESILTADGRKMLNNFLKMKGGTWAENESMTSSNAGIKPQVNGGEQNQKAPESILERIYRHRRAAVEIQGNIPSQRFPDLQEAHSLGLAPPLISFETRVRQSPYSLSLMAEIKRASPSKGPIAMTICAPAQARKYAAAGASVISVLTEPEWFKGSIDDLRSVRQSLEAMPNRPAVLRKEFVFSEYQILEARIAGADTILLIVKMLDPETLQRLYKYSQLLGMEPLVEVNTEQEMATALGLGARVIGVNNRDLKSFKVDLGTTSRLMDKVPKDVFICALSGISSPDDVEEYKQHNVGGVLIGEALMRASDVEVFVKTLLGTQEVNGIEASKAEMLVKICGTRTVEAAGAAVRAGADMVGIILAEGRKRTVSNDIALQISKVVHSTERSIDRKTMFSGSAKAQHFFGLSTQWIRRSRHPLLVGVFQNQPLSYILEQQRVLDLDIVQLHGEEPVEWATLIPVPVIHRFNPNDTELSKRGYHALPLLDSAVGGTGQSTDIAEVERRLLLDPGLSVILAGGLTPENLSGTFVNSKALRHGIVAVDVSSGVEENGSQSLERIKNFIATAKQL